MVIFKIKSLQQFQQISWAWQNSSNCRFSN